MEAEAAAEEERKALAKEARKQESAQMLEDQLRKEEQEAQVQDLGNLHSIAGSGQG